MLETLIGLVVVQVVTQVVSYLQGRSTAKRLNKADSDRAEARRETSAHIRELQESVDAQVRRLAQSTEAAVAALPKKRTRKPKAEQ